MIFADRISNFFFYSLFTLPRDKLQPPAAAAVGAAPEDAGERAGAGAALEATLRGLTFTYPLKSPQNSKSKLCAAGKVIPLPENKANHSLLL